MEKETKHNRYTSTDILMLLVTVIFVGVAFYAVGRIVWFETVWQPDARCLKMKDFKTQSKERIIQQQRGNILDCDGRLLAITIPTYMVELDCAVHKEYYKTLTGKSKEHKGMTNGEVAEREWREKARGFAKGLPEVLGNGRSAEWYEREIFSRRDGSGGNKNLRIADDVDFATLKELQKLPLADMGQNAGGVIVKTKYGREYPYGKLARRVIGYVRNNDEGSRAKGIEGSLNYVLHGEPGVEWTKVIDGRARVMATDSVAVPVKDGDDVRLTLDIDIQDIADRAVRKHIEDDDNITDACMIIMDVRSGAIKAMVNLHKGRNGKFDETLNIALTQATFPGSVFKTVGLMTELEDKKVTLGTRLSINKLQSLPEPFDKTDPYLVKYKKETGNSTISVLEGLEISSNNVFISLALDNYKSCPREFITRYYNYGFGTDWKFDITGMARTVLPDPDSKSWTYSDLGALAYGYSVQVTPLHTLAFYNAIANGGKLMKPYIVDAVLDCDGKVVSKAKPVAMHETICSKATADTLKRALRSVVTNGTGSALKRARCSVAGKTGTAWMILPKEICQPGKQFVTKDGYRRYQGSFAGFFPAEDPVYSAIVVVYSGMTKTPYYGGSRPAKALNEVINELYAMDPRWRRTVSASEPMPEAPKKVLVAERQAPEIAPNVVGMGLNEALYMIENSGFRCKFSGTGHVVGQTPAAGKALKKGETITIVLK